MSELGFCPAHDGCADAPEHAMTHAFGLSPHLPELAQPAPSIVFTRPADILKSNGAASAGSTKPTAGSLLKPLAQVTPKATDWLWRGHIARATLHIIAGRGGAGKTTLTIDLLARATNGTPWPCGSANPTRGDVIVLSTEEDESTLHAKFAAAGADLSRVHLLPLTFSFQRSMRDLEIALQGLQNPVAILIDPILAVIESGDANEAASVRRQLGKVVDLCHRYNVAAVGVSHLSKGSEQRDPAERVLASGAFTALSRMVWLVTRDRSRAGAEHDRLMVVVKSNIARGDRGWRLGIREHDLERGIETLQTTWGEQVHGDVVDMLKAAEGGGDNTGANAGNEAEEFLLKTLADGPQAAASIIEEGRKRGVTERRVRTAFDKLGGKSTKAGFNAPRMWQLPRGLQNSQSSQSSRPTLQGSKGVDP